MMDLEAIRALPEGRQQLVEILRFTRRPDNIDAESDALLTDGIAYARKVDEQALLTELLVNKALIANYKKANDEAIALLDEAFAMAIALPGEQRLAPLNAMAIGYRRAGQPDKALAAHEQHNALTQGKSDHNMVMHRITNLQNQASLFHYRGRFDQVKQCNREVMELIQLIDDPRLIFNITFNLASMLISIDEVEEASALLNELMPAIERNTDGRAPRFYELVADHARRKGDTPRAAEFFAKVFHTRTANPQQKLRSATQLARCYITMLQADSVEKYVGISRELRANPVANYSDVDQVLLDAQYAAFGADYPAAKAMFLEACRLRPGDSELYPIPVFEAHVELAKLYHRTGRSDSAQYYLAKSGAHVQDLNIPKYLKMQYYAATETINPAPQAGGDNDSVIAALKHQLALKDSLYNHTTTQAYAEMESKYNLHATKHQLRLARQQQEIQALELKRQEQRVVIFALIGSLVIISLGFAAIMMVRRRKQVKERHESQLKQLAQQHRIATARALREAESEERRKIAGKLHDELGAQLSIVRLNVDQLEPHVFVAESAASAKLHAAQRMLSDISETVRTISHSMMPVALEKYGLKAAILDLVDAVNTSGKIKAEQVIEGLDHTDKWSDEFRLGLYRIVHEIINNIIKHAQASHVLLQLVELEHSVTVYVEDNGKGLESSGAQLGVGLNLLKSNIEYFNGAIEINGRENQGTFVLIELPLETK